MARPLRIQFPDAWYHVMNRGRRGDLIFKDKGDYYAFVGLLKDCEKGVTPNPDFDSNRQI